MRTKANRGALCGLALIFAAAVSISSAVASEAPQVTVRLGADEIYLGESVDYQVTLQNIKTPSAPDMSAFAADFTVAPAGERSLDQHVHYNFNGHEWSQDVYGHVYGYRLTPKRAGQLAIPAPVAALEGDKKISGRALTLTVIAPEKQDLALMEIVASQTQVYPTQPFDVTLRILLKPLPDGNRREPLALLQEPPHLEINWLETPEGLSSGDCQTWLSKLTTNTGQGFRLNNVTSRGNDIFSMFEQQAAVFNLYTGREFRTGLNGEKIEYFAYELKRTFTPDKTGFYKFGPALLKGQFVDGISGRRYSGRRLVVNALAKTVEAKEVPLPRPPTFCGGIGSYRINASAQPLSARVGDPLTLTIEMRRQQGAGSLALLSAPDLTANPQLAADFDIIDKAPVGEVKNEVKRFSYGLRARKAGVNIPPLTITLFNPETGQFADNTTPLIKLDITSGAQMSAGEVVGAVVPAVTPAIKVHEHGVFQNLTDISELGNQRVQPAWYVLGAFAAWLLYALLSFFVIRHRRLSGDRVWQRRQRGRASALRQLHGANEALAAGRPAEALRLVRAALAGLIGDMLDLPSTGMTAREADNALTGAGIESETRSQAVALMENIEAAEYGSVAAQDASGLLASAKPVLLNLHRALEAKK